VRDWVINIFALVFTYIDSDTVHRLHLRTKSNAQKCWVHPRYL